MTPKTRLSEDRTLNLIALALQGMAIWHMLLGVAALAFTLTLVASGASLEDDRYVISGITAAEVTGVGLAAGVLLVVSVGRYSGGHSGDPAGLSF